MSYTSKYTFNHILTDKESLHRSYIDYMLSRTQQIFVYKGLPDSIPAKELELILQTAGNATIARVKGGIYDGQLVAFRAGLGERPNIYYLPTKAIIANPYYNDELDIGKECVLIRNDLLMVGLMPMMCKYACQLAEADISLRWALVNARVPAILKADNDSTAESGRQYLKDLEEGRKLGMITSTAFAEEGISTIPYGNSSADKIKDLLEAQQYIMSKWYNELGLQSNFNMKREAINEAEAGMNEDSLRPLVDEMLALRKEGVEAINEMFGLNISVELNSAWKEKEENETERNDDVA